MCGTRCSCAEAVFILEVVGEPTLLRHVAAVVCCNPLCGRVSALGYRPKGLVGLPHNVCCVVVWRVVFWLTRQSTHWQLHRGRLLAELLPSARSCLCPWVSARGVGRLTVQSGNRLRGRVFVHHGIDDAWLAMFFFDFQDGGGGDFVA